MNRSFATRPLVPEDLRRGARQPGETFRRAVVAQLLAAAKVYSSEEQALKALFGGDETAGFIIKAATSPATTTTSGWASQLAQTVVADFLGDLGEASAASGVFARSMRLTFGRESAVAIPALLPSANDVVFVQEGAPIPVVDFSVANTTLSPRKLASITVFTRAMVESSNADAIIRASLNESVGLRLDSVLFDATAGDAVRPPGLRAGIAAIAASALTPATEAMQADLRALAAAVAPVAGNGPIVFVASPGQAVSIRMRVAGNLAYDVLASSALTAGTVLAIAPRALAVVVEPAPEFEIRTGGTLHMDNAPSAIGIAGSPNVISAPTRDLYQTDSVGLKVRLGVSWGLRTSGAISWVENAGW